MQTFALKPQPPFLYSPRDELELNYFLILKQINYKFIDERGIYFAADASAPDNPQNRSHKPLIHPLTKKEKWFYGWVSRRN